MSLIENIQREDLNPLEEAQAIRRLIDEFEMTHQAAADAVGRSRTSVTNLLRLLELHDAVKEHVNEGRLEMGHARCLLALPLDDQPGVAATVVKRDMTVRATEQLVKKVLSAQPEPRKDSGPSPEVRQLESRLSDRLGAPRSGPLQPAREGPPGHRVQQPRRTRRYPRTHPVKRPPGLPETPCNRPSRTP